jgi:hypothetical protein
MWAQYAIRNPHFGHVTSNIVELINSAWFLAVHEEPILQALGKVWKILMDKFYTHHRRKFMRSQDFIDWAQNYINRQTLESRAYKVTECDAYQFQVSQYGKSSAVDLMNEKGSSGEFQNLKLPCRHAIAAISYGHYSIGTYVNDVYLQKTYYTEDDSDLDPEYEDC